MTQIHLSDTQALILSAAVQRPENIALPLPSSLRGGATSKVVSAMISKGLLQEVDADLSKGEPLWRESGDGHGVTLIATDAGLDAIGVEVEDVNPARLDANEAPSDVLATDNTSTQPKTAPTARTPRENTKQAKLITMLRAPDGATLEEFAAALAWRPHTIRGAMAGALKKKLGLTINSEKIEGRGRVYALK